MKIHNMNKRHKNRDATCKKQLQVPDKVWKYPIQNEECTHIIQLHNFPPWQLRECWQHIICLWINMDDKIFWMLFFSFSFFFSFWLVYPLSLIFKFLLFYYLSKCKKNNIFFSCKKKEINNITMFTLRAL